jgi:rod shape-determining protein MreD
MDVADGTLFGQHALSYTILAYAGIVLHRRVRMFALTSQMLHVVTLLLMNDVIVVMVRALGGAEFPGFHYFIGSFVGGALWPFMVTLFRLPQRPQADPDHA